MHLSQLHTLVLQRLVCLEFSHLFDLLVLDSLRFQLVLLRLYYGDTRLFSRLEASHDEVNIVLHRVQAVSTAFFRQGCS